MLELKLILMNLPNQLLLNFADIKHPVEGIAYLIIFAIIFRWRLPEAWNKFLKKISAKA